MNTKTLTSLFLALSFCVCFSKSNPLLGLIRPSPTYPLVPVYLAARIAAPSCGCQSNYNNYYPYGCNVCGGYGSNSCNNAVNCGCGYNNCNGNCNYNSCNCGNCYNSNTNENCSCNNSEYCNCNNNNNNNNNENCNCNTNGNCNCNNYNGNCNCYNGGNCNCNCN